MSHQYIFVVRSNRKCVPFSQVKINLCFGLIPTVNKNLHFLSQEKQNTFLFLIKNKSVGLFQQVKYCYF